MKRTFLLTAIAATLLAGSGSLVLAQEAGKTTVPEAMPSAQAMPGHPQGHLMGMTGMHHGEHARGEGMHHGMHGRHHGGPAAAVIQDLHQIARLYIMEGKARELPGFYKGVLARTRDPMVRNDIYRSLARAQMMPRDPEAAIATLRTRLDENLARLDAESPAKR